MKRKKWVSDILNKAKKCYYCELTFGATDHSINAGIKTKDHIIPLTKRGKDIEENIVVACRWCNEEKGDMSLVDFFNHILKMDSLTQLQRDKDLILENIALLTRKIDPYYNRLFYKKHEVFRVKQLRFETTNKVDVKKPKITPKMGGKDYCADIHLSVNSNTRKSPHRDSNNYVQWIPGEPDKTKETKLSIVGAYFNKLYGSPNTPSKEKILYLQSQTVEQFTEKRTMEEMIKYQLSLPEPNFHIQE